jgi:hypothetical protein
MIGMRGSVISAGKDAALRELIHAGFNSTCHHLFVVSGLFIAFCLDYQGYRQPKLPG